MKNFGAVEGGNSIYLNPRIFQNWNSFLENTNFKKTFSAPGWINWGGGERKWKGREDECWHQRHDGKDTCGRQVHVSLPGWVKCRYRILSGSFTRYLMDHTRKGLPFPPYVGWELSSVLGERGFYGWLVFVLIWVFLFFCFTIFMRSVNL